MKTKTSQQKKAEIRPLITTGHQLLSDDIKLIHQLAKLKAEVKRLETYLKPRIQTTAAVCGTGTFIIGGLEKMPVQLSKTERSSVSWKSLAHALSSEEEINSVVDNFTVLSISYGARIVS